MIFKNTREGRNQILDEIGKLLSQGYTREDIKNKSVTMRKTTKGKVCSATDIVEYTFQASDMEIHKVSKTLCADIDKAKSMLYGWSPPKVEVRNAVIAGLFNEADAAILRMQYSNDQWHKSG